MTLSPQVSTSLVCVCSLERNWRKGHKSDFTRLTIIFANEWEERKAFHLKFSVKYSTNLVAIVGVEIYNGQQV